MGLPMENDLEQITEPKSKFGTEKNLLSLTFQSLNIVLIDHVIYLITIWTKNPKIDTFDGLFEKRSREVSFFSFILINFYHFTFGMTVHRTSIKKKTEQKHHFQFPNLILIY